MPSISFWRFSKISATKANWKNRNQRQFFDAGFGSAVKLTYSFICNNLPTIKVQNYILLKEKFYHWNATIVFDIETIR